MSCLRRNATALILAGILLVAAVLASLSWKVGHDWGDDFAAYIGQGRSLVAGNPAAYVEMNSTATRYSAPVLSLYTYPWGFPLLLAPVVAVFGTNLLAMRWLCLAIFLASLLPLYALLRRRLDRTLSLSLVAALAWNPVLLGATNSILSDLPLLLFSTFSILMIDDYAHGLAQRPTLVRCVHGVTLGAAIAAATLMRINGALLLPALAIQQLVATRAARQGWRLPGWRDLLVMAIPYAVFALLFGATTLVLPVNGFRVQLVDWRGLVSNLQYYVLLCTDLYRPLFPALLYGATLPFLALGIAARWRQDCVMIAFSAMTLALYVILPGLQGMRYLFPIVPYYLYLVVAGLAAVRVERAFWARLQRHAGWLPRLAIVGLAAYFLLASAGYGYRNVSLGRAVEGPYSPDGAAMLAYVREHTAPDDVVAFGKPRAMLLYGGRRSFATDEPDMLSHADYAVVFRQSCQCWQSEPLPGTADVVYENAGFLVYRMRAPRAAG